jgi:hypothetical protein
VNGWLLPDGGEPAVIELLGPRGAVRTAERVERPDIAAAYAGVPGALEAGFTVSLGADEFVDAEGWDFTIRARRRDGDLFLCRVRRPCAHRAAEPGSRIDRDGILHL